MTQQQLAELIGKSQSTVTHVERGFKDASSELIAAIAQQTGFPISFFTTEPTVEFHLESLLFRARASMTRRNAMAICRYAEIIYEMVEMLSNYVTPLPLKLRKSLHSPAEAAQETRRWLELPFDTPIPHLINSVERCGIIVLALPLHDLEEIDAFSSWAETKPVIAVCVGKPGDRVRWSTGHELGHLVLHAEKKIRTEEHREADRFAAELLLPETAMRREIVSPVTLSSLAMLKPRWGVAIQALIRRAHDLKIITDRHYRYLFEQLSMRGWRTQEPENLNIPVEKPRALRKMVELSPFGSNYRTLASELRITEETLKEVLDLYDDLSSLIYPENQRPSSKVIPLRRKQTS